MSVILRKTRDGESQGLREHAQLKSVTRRYVFRYDRMSPGSLWLSCAPADPLLHPWAADNYSSDPAETGTIDTMGTAFLPQRVREPIHVKSAVIRKDLGCQRCLDIGRCRGQAKVMTWECSVQ